MTGPELPSRRVPWDVLTLVFCFPSRTGRDRTLAVTSRGQMIDRICVKVQDHLNSLRNCGADAVQEDLKAAERLMRDAKNSKTVSVGSGTRRLEKTAPASARSCSSPRSLPGGGGHGRHLCLLSYPWGAEADVLCTGSRWVLHNRQAVVLGAAIP